MTLGKCLFNSLQLKGKDRSQVSGRAFLCTCSVKACKNTSRWEVPKRQVLSLQQLLLSDSLQKKLYKISVCIKTALLIFSSLSCQITLIKTSQSWRFDLEWTDTNEILVLIKMALTGMQQGISADAVIRTGLKMLGEINCCNVQSWPWTRLFKDEQIIWVLSLATASAGWSVTQKWQALILIIDPLIIAH